MTIDAGVVTNAKLAPMAALSVKANSTASVLAPTDIPFSTFASTIGAMRRLAVGCSAAAATTVPHFFGTRDIHVQVYRNSTPWDTVECDIRQPDVNNVVVTFSVAPTASGDYRIVIMG